MVDLAMSPSELVIEVSFHDEGRPPEKWGRFAWDGQSVKVSEVSDDFSEILSRGIYSAQLKRGAQPADGAAFMDALQRAYRQSSSIEARVISPAPAAAG